MQEQNFSNHSRFVTLYHFVTVPFLVAILTGASINLCNSSESNLYSASLILCLTIALSLTFYFARAFALKANDRAIRAEENFRHFILTGKPLPTGLRSSQIVALRFASDAEFPALAAKSVAENTKIKEIKQSIINWKADNNRV
jgi:hypothetical protein